MTEVSPGAAPTQVAWLAHRVQSQQCPAGWQQPLLGTAADLLHLDYTTVLQSSTTVGANFKFCAASAHPRVGRLSQGAGQSHAYTQSREESREESIPEEAARLWVAGRSEQERGWVPRREGESWLGLMHEAVGVLRLSLVRSGAWRHHAV